MSSRTSPSPKLLFAALFALLCAPLIPSHAHADESGAPSPAGQAGVYDASAGAPEAGAAVSNGDSIVSVDPATGTIAGSRLAL